MKTKKVIKEILVWIGMFLWACAIVASTLNFHHLVHP